MADYVRRVARDWQGVQLYVSQWGLAVGTVLFLVLLTLVPLRMLQTWSQGVLAVGVGGLLKQRLLYGARAQAISQLGSSRP